MRNLLLAGTAGLFVTLGGAAAYAVPQNSPYATMVPPDAVDGYAPDGGSAYACPGYSLEVGCPAGVVEGRSAYVDPDYYGYDGPAYIAPGFGYGFGYYGGFRGAGGHFAGGHFGGGFRHGR